MYTNSLSRTHIASSINLDLPNPSSQLKHFLYSLLPQNIHLQ
jgi:hypothetical protein